MPQLTLPFSHSEKPLPFHIPGAAFYNGRNPIAPTAIHPSDNNPRETAKGRVGATTEQECSPFSSEAAARAFLEKCAEKPKEKTQAERLEEARALVKAHLAADARCNERASEDAQALDQARADAAAYNESKKEVR